MSAIFLEKGDDYEEVHMAIMINLLNFDLFPREIRYHQAFVLVINSTKNSF